jgi:acyl-CoA synthetase (NDP forming)
MTYTRALATLLGADDVDGVLLTGYFGGYSTQESTMADLEVAAAEAMAALVTGQAKPVVVQTIHPQGRSGRLLRAAGLPVHRDVDRAAAVLSGLVERPLPALVEMPMSTGTPVADTSYDAARRLFAEAGVPFPAARTVHDVAGLDDALDADGIAFPVVLKALGRVHKSDGGGVVLGLRDRSAARSAYASMVASLAPVAVSVEAMVDAPDGVELIVGCVHDPRFGPVLMVGLGGVLADVLDDTAVALAPVSEEAARGLLLSLRGAPLLLGTRGRAPVDLGAVAAIVARVSEVAATHPELAELELNPVLARTRGVVALDARLVLGVEAQEPRSSPTSAR